MTLFNGFLLNFKQVSLVANAPPLVIGQDHSKSLQFTFRWVSKVTFILLEIHFSYIFLGFKGVGAQIRWGRWDALYILAFRHSSAFSFLYCIWQIFHSVNEWNTGNHRIECHSSHESRTRGTKTGFILFALAISVIGSKAEPSFPYWRTSEVREAQGNIINIKYHHK